MSSESKSIAGKVAIVTGAGKGIGQAIAERYGREGAKVVVADIDTESAHKVAATITAASGTAIAVAANIAEEAAVDALFTQTVNAALRAPTKHRKTGRQEEDRRVLLVFLSSCLPVSLSYTQLGV